jgi:putative SOS response-associated peptidase YedK
MCGRANVIDNPELQQLLKELGIDLGLPSRSNIAPTDAMLMIRQVDGVNEPANVRWWLTPSWAREMDQKYSMFNARSESIASSRAYKGPFKYKRGIVPVSSFIEWRSEEGGRQPYLIEAEGAGLALACVWDCWEGILDGAEAIIESCSVVTTAAAPEFEQYHKRMPVMLTANEYDEWLDCSERLPADTPLFRPQLKQPLLISPISREVNNARNKQVELLQPLGAAVRLAA